MTAIDVYLALDVGDARIGVALARGDVRIASPLTTISNDAGAQAQLLRLIKEHNVTRLIVGLPRNLNGDETSQTTTARSFSQLLAASCALPVVLQDEALTSVKAEAELKARHKPFDKADIDALAATYILEDYLQDSQERSAQHVS